MSEHPWIQENLAAYLAGGLDAAETGRLEQHVAGCKPCARLLEESRHLDQSLSALFSGAQPEAGFEDRALRRTRKVSQRRWPRVLRYVKYAAAAAAVLGVAGVGVTVNSLIGKGEFGIPDQSVFASLGSGSGMMLSGEQALDYFMGGLPNKASESSDNLVTYAGRDLSLDNDHKQQNMPADGARPKVASEDVVAAVKDQQAGSLISGANASTTHGNRQEQEIRWGEKSSGLVVTDQLVDQYVLKDAEIKGYLNEIDKTNQYMAKLRIIAAAPESLPEYKEYVGIVNDLNKKLTDRKAIVRPDLRKRLEDIANIKPTNEPDSAQVRSMERASRTTPEVAAKTPSSNTNPRVEDPIFPLPVGHDRMDKGGFQLGGELLHFRQTNPIKDQVVAVRGILDFDGSITSDLNGLPTIPTTGGPPKIVSGTPQPGTFLGSGAPGLNSKVDLTSREEFGVEIGLQSPVLFQRGIYPNSVSTADSRGTNQNPSGSKVGEVKIAGNTVTRDVIQNQIQGQTQNSLNPFASPGFNFNASPGLPALGNSPLASPGVVGAQGVGILGRKQGGDESGSKAEDNVVLYAGSVINGSTAAKGLPSNEKLDFFKPSEIKLGEQKEQSQLGRDKQEQGKSDGAKSDFARNALNQAEDPGPARQKGNQGAPTKTPSIANPAPRKVIIRTGELEFEVESFDAATAVVNRLVNAVPGGFVATTNSEKLPNGKMRGSVVVRVPPEHLDALVENLRKDLAKGSELKNQRIGSQDVTKQFTDLESRLKAARTMEERLLQIIKTGKGEIKDLLNVEKELGVWHTKIEEMEGELRFMGQQVALSTLTISMTEKEIRAPYGMLETERINMGLEVEDVEKAQKQALAIVAEVKGRITKSELQQLAAGQFSSIINFEVPPDTAGLVRDRLKQVGNQSRLDVNRVMEAEGGTGKPQDGKVTRKDAQFFLSLYNLANVAPREVTNFDVATSDAEAAYKAVLTRIEKLGGRVVTSNLNRQNNDQTVGTINFQVKTAEADGFVQELKAIGETLRHQTTESSDSANTTRSKRGFVLQILAYGSVPARETTTMQMATPDVPISFRKLQEAIVAAKGRMLSAQLNEQNRQNATATLDFEVRRENEAAVRTALDGLGDVLARNVARVAENESALNSKVRLQVTLLDAARIPPRETTTLGLEVSDVDMASTNFAAQVRERGGRTVGSTASRERSGRVSSKLVFYVPLAASADLVNQFKSAGVVRVLEKERNPQVSDGSLAVARIDVTLSNSELIVPSDQGLWPQIRKGLSTSFVGLSWSLTVVIIGILFVLPWAIAVYGGYRVVRWMRRA